MRDAYIYDAVRTPRGKGREGGGLHEISAIELAASLIRAAFERLALPRSACTDVILGSVTQTGEQGANVAKVAAMAAGLPDSVSGITVNRYCTSSLDACHFAAMKVMTGTDELVLAGGVESMSRVPLMSDRATYYSMKPIGAAAPFVPMGLAADLVANVDGITRTECDEYAVSSHHRAARAEREQRFSRALISVEAGNGLLDRDECVRADANVERLTGFEPLFGNFCTPEMMSLFQDRFPAEIGISDFQHIHHAANSPAIVDGASLVVFGSAAAGDQFGLRPRAKVRCMCNSANDPVLALTGGIAASGDVVRRADMSPADIDLVEFNEAFASVSIKFGRESPWDADQINVNGGALALGHAMGATGGSLLGTLLDELERQDLNTGLVAVSGAAGTGTATIIERV